MTFWSDHTVPHLINSLVHILLGTATLLLGIGALCVTEGGAAHRRLGTLFLYSLGVIVGTAGIGLILFSFQPYLAIVVMLSFYDAFWGMRAIKLRGARPQALDRAVSFVAFLSPVVFIALMHALHKPWSPILTDSILGGLLAMSSYDLDCDFVCVRRHCLSLLLAVERRCCQRCWIDHNQCLPPVGAMRLEESAAGTPCHARAAAFFKSMTFLIRLGPAASMLVCAALIHYATIIS